MINEQSQKPQVTCWGVRGSVPAPITAKDLQEKYVEIINAFVEAQPKDLKSFLEMRQRVMPATFGGNTSCVEIKSGKTRFVLDMGTGLRPLGNSLFEEMFNAGGLEIFFFLSHVHWDHIQGLPFFGPLYINKEIGIKNRWHFLGGTDWLGAAEICLKGQMDAPTFPVSFKEIEQTTTEITYRTVHDRMTVVPVEGGPTVLCRKLNHPQETYGYRFTFPDESVIAYTTDQEPFDPSEPDPRLVELARGADIWITDCQYTKDQYNGVDKARLPRHAWGHSYPEAVAQTAVVAGVKKVVLFHHDPASDDRRIEEMRQHTQELINVDLKGSSQVIAAYEGLTIEP